MTVFAAVAVRADAAAAQSPGALRFGAAQPEVRADGIVADAARTAQFGAGVLWPVGRAVRVGAVAAAGVADGDGAEGADGDAASGATLGWRAEAVAHFVVRTGPTGRARLYAGAGAGFLDARAGSGRAVAHLLLGLEGDGAGWAPAVELGLGGGVRLGVALRRAR